MENQHRKITGYRELTQEEIDLMNEIKAQGESLDKLVERLESLPFSDPSDESALLEVFDAALEANQWLCEGKMALKKGLMFLTRAVARPTSF